MNHTQSSQILTRINDWLLRHRASLYAAILVVALVSVEGFNYSTTQVALKDLLGSIKFIGIPWYAILALAFCCIDFAGVARLFIPDDQAQKTESLWYLFGAWLLAATVNALLTWWGVAMALADHAPSSTHIIDPSIIYEFVPVMVAVMVWVTRILLIASFSRNGLSRPMSGRAAQSSRLYPRASTSPQYTPAAAALSARPALTSAAPRTSSSTPVQRPFPVARPTVSRELEYVSEPASTSPQPTYRTLTAASPARPFSQIRS